MRQETVEENKQERKRERERRKENELIAPARVLLSGLILKYVLRVSF